MLYFFHHYELPLILRQVQLQNLLLRTTSSHATGGGAGAAAAPDDAASADVRTPGSEVQAETETIDRDSDDSPPFSETPSDDSEIESGLGNSVSPVSAEETGGATGAAHPPPQDAESLTA